MPPPRIADQFDEIRARLDELRDERKSAPRCSCMEIATAGGDRVRAISATCPIHNRPSCPGEIAGWALLPRRFSS